MDENESDCLYPACASAVETLEEVAELVRDALMTSGEANKQWYLELIADLVGAKINHLPYEPGQKPIPCRSTM